LHSRIFFDLIYDYARALICKNMFPASSKIAHHKNKDPPPPARDLLSRDEFVAHNFSSLKILPTRPDTTNALAAAESADAPRTAQGKRTRAHPQKTCPP
jgi:hypothetical protein